jgi:leucyl aminopeptidase (aminopeptidase T)
MYPLELIHSVRLITDVCLEVGPGEDVLCTADGEEKMDFMTLIAAECRARGANASVVLLEPRRQHYLEPPPSIAKAMRTADIVITYGELMHTQARKDACAAGAKFAALGDLPKEYLVRLNITREDLMEVRALTEKIARRLTDAKSAHLTNGAGTDLHMSLEGRNGIALLPFGMKGAFCVVPCYAEAPIAPVETSVEGVAVVDGTMVGEPSIEGLIKEPFKVYFEKGRVVKISDGPDAHRLKNLFSNIEPEARTFAELGVNSNHKIPKTLTGTRIDDAVAGHIHFGMGRNDHIGGESRAKSHLDFLIPWATLRLDKDLILEEGNLTI